MQADLPRQGQNPHGGGGGGGNKESILSFLGKDFGVGAKFCDHSCWLLCFIQVSLSRISEFGPTSVTIFFSFVFIQCSLSRISGFGSKGLTSNLGAFLSKFSSHGFRGSKTEKLHTNGDSKVDGMGAFGGCAAVSRKR